MVDALSSPLSEHGTDIMVADVEKAGPSEDNAWRLNFNSIERPERDAKPEGGLHRCFNVLGLTLPVGQVYLVESRDGITSEFRQNI